MLKKEGFPGKWFWGPLAAAVLLGILFLVAGCGEPGYLQSEVLRGKKLGVCLETEMGPREALITALVEYLGGRTTLQVVGQGALGGYLDKNLDILANFRRLREQGIDYLLLVKLSDIRPMQQKRDIHLSPGNFRVHIGYQCTLTLTYRVVDLQKEEVVFLGQSQGRAEESVSAYAGKWGFGLQLDDMDRDRLIEKAMLDAVRRTKLI